MNTSLNFSMIGFVSISLDSDAATIRTDAKQRPSRPLNPVKGDMNFLLVLLVSMFPMFADVTGRY
jgi:hypothetical protein